MPNTTSSDKTTGKPGLRLPSSQQVVGVLTLTVMALSLTAIAAMMIVDAIWYGEPTVAAIATPSVIALALVIVGCAYAFTIVFQLIPPEYNTQANMVTSSLASAFIAALIIHWFLGTAPTGSETDSSRETHLNATAVDCTEQSVGFFQPDGRVLLQRATILETQYEPDILTVRFQLGPADSRAAFTVPDAAALEAVAACLHGPDAPPVAATPPVASGAQ